MTASLLSGRRRRTFLTSPPVAGLRRLRDPLYRNAAALLANTVLASGLGFVFWMLAARVAPAAAVGTLSATVSTVVLLGTAASLGLPNALVPTLATAGAAARRLVLGGAGLTVGASFVVLALVWFTPLAPPLARAGTPAAPAVCLLLVASTAAGMVLDAGFLAGRRASLILLKNVLGGSVRIGCLALPAAAPLDRLVVAHLAGSALSVAASLVLLHRSRSNTGADGPDPSSWAVPREVWPLARANHLAMVVGIAPVTLTPLLVIHTLGSAAAAYTGVCLMLLALLHMLPAALSQSLFAETAHQRHRGRDAAMTTYALLLPAVVVALVAAPWALQTAGAEYSEAATPMLRWLVAGAPFAAVSYLVDATVNGRRDGAGYLVLNLQNSFWVVGLVALATPLGLTAVGAAWCVGQAVAAACALGYLWHRTRHTNLERAR